MINLQGDHTSKAMCLHARYTLDDSVKSVYILFVSDVFSKSVGLSYAENPRRLWTSKVEVSEASKVQSLID